MNNPAPCVENLFGKSYKLCRKLFCKQQRKRSIIFFGFLSFNTLNLCSHQHIPELAQTRACTSVSVKKKYHANFRHFSPSPAKLSLKRQLVSSWEAPPLSDDLTVSRMKIVSNCLIRVLSNPADAFRINEKILK